MARRKKDPATGESRAPDAADLKRGAELERRFRAIAGAPMEGRSPHRGSWLPVAEGRTHVLVTSAAVPAAANLVHDPARRRDSSLVASPVCQRVSADLKPS